MIIDHLIHKYLIKNQFYRHTSLMSAGQLYQNVISFTSNISQKETLFCMTLASASQLANMHQLYYI